jgi:hypothetical protein
VRSDIQWPKKTRELHSHQFEPTIWNELDFRDDDSATYEGRAVAELGAECARWLATGEWSPGAARTSGRPT